MEESKVDKPPIDNKKKSLCNARTHEGIQCQMAVSKKDETLCHIHKRVPKRKLLLMVPFTPEPWVTMGFKRVSLQYLKDVPSSVKKRLRNLCWRQPTNIDRSGWIYIYTCSADKSLPYYKLGTTERSPEIRIKEWSSDHKSEINLVRSFGVSHHKISESILFVLLDNIRLVRHYNINDKKYTTVWKDTNKPVTKKDKVRIEKGLMKKEDCKRHIEWFRVPAGELVLFEIIRDVVRIVNEWERYSRCLDR
jgi:hypothetical protein